MSKPHGWTNRTSFGPVITIGSTKHDDFRASCSRCCFRHAGLCTHKNPPRVLPTIIDRPHLDDTPEWCEMRASTIADAKEMYAKQRATWSLRAASSSTRNNDECERRVAAALRDSMPGLTAPEAWPWRLLARAAITAMCDDDTTKRAGDIARARGGSKAG